MRHASLPSLAQREQLQGVLSHFQKGPGVIGPGYFVASCHSPWRSACTGLRSILRATEPVERSCHLHPHPVSASRNDHAWVGPRPSTRQLDRPTLRTRYNDTLDLAHRVCDLRTSSEVGKARNRPNNVYRSRCRLLDSDCNCRATGRSSEPIRCRRRSSRRSRNWDRHAKPIRTS